MTPGPQPTRELAARLANLTGATPATLLRDLESDPRSLDLAARSLRAAAASKRLLLVVDQFEEVFSLCRDVADRSAFLAALLSAANTPDPAAVIVVTLRADFYGRCLEDALLSRAIEENSLLVGPVTEEELRAIIQRPAAGAGLDIEPGLVETLLHDVAGQPGALPLLSHSLLETWKRRRGRALTLAGYREAGGVSGALARTADSVYAALGPEQQALARQLLLRMIELGESRWQDTRRRVRIEEVAQSPEARGVLRALTDARLVVVSEDEAEVAHEALIREWPALRNWLDRDRELLRAHQQLAEDAHEWDGLGRDPGALLRGSRLALAAEFVSDRGEELNRLERDFFEASRAAQIEEVAAQRRRADQLRRLATYLAGALLAATASLGIAVTLGLFARAQRNEARHQGREVLAGKLAAQAIARLDSQLDLSLLLAVEAHRVSDTLETRSALLSVLTHRTDLVRFLFGNREQVSSLAISVDSRWLLSGSYDGTARLWDLESGKPAYDPYETPGEPVCSVAISPDGHQIVVGGASGKIHIWRFGRGDTLERILEKHAGAVWSLAFSPDGSRLASASADRTVCLWDAVSGTLAGEPLIGHTDEVVCVAFAPDGKLLASGSNNRTIRLWDVQTGRAVGQPMTGHTHSVWALAFSPGGEILASGGPDYSIRLWSTRTRLPIGRPLEGHTNSVDGLAFSPDGNSLISGGADDRIRIWDVRGLREAREPFAGNAGSLFSFAASRDLDWFATGSMDGAIALWKPGAIPAIARELGRHDSGSVSTVVYAGDSGWASLGEDRTLRAWGGSAGAVRTIDVDRLMAAAIAPSGRIAATTDRMGGLRIWNVADGAPLSPLIRAGDRMIFSIAFSPDSRILVAGSEIGRPLSGHSSAISSLAWSPDGRRLVTGAPTRASSNGISIRTHGSKPRNAVPAGDSARKSARNTWVRDSRHLAPFPCPHVGKGNTLSS